MALNRAYIGQEWEAPVPYEVGVEKVREFAVAIGAPDTDGFVRSALDPDSDPPAVPPTFVTSMWFRMGVWPLREPDFGKSATPRFLLGEQQVTRHRPMVVGDRVLFRTRVRTFAPSAHTSCSRWSTPSSTWPSNRYAASSTR